MVDYWMWALIGLGLGMVLLLGIGVVVGILVGGWLDYEGLIDWVLHFHSRWKREDYGPSIRQFLDEHGKEPITELVALKTPIRTYIDTLMDLCTRQTWSAVKRKYGYETIYHTALMATMGTHRVLINKLAVPVVQTEWVVRSQTEWRPIPLSKPIILNDLLTNTQRAMGTDFWGYEGFRNNCQTWAVEVLRANGLLNPEHETWIHQNLHSLVPDLPTYVPSVANFITTLWAQF